MEFKLTVHELHESLSVKNPKVDPSKSSLRVEHANKFKNLILSSNAPLDNLLKYIYFIFLDIMNLNDKISEELRSNLDNSISTIKNSPTVLADDDRLEIILKNAYAYSYELLLFFKLESDKATAKHLSVAFKNIRNYIKQIEENCLLSKNQSNSTIDKKVSKPLSTMSSNLFKSIPMNDRGTFKIFRELQIDNIKFFYNFDCFNNEYYFKEGLEALSSMTYLPQVKVRKILEKVNDELPTKDKKNNNKIISSFLYEIISKYDVKSYDNVFLLSMMLVKFQACFDFLNIRNVELGENFIHKFQNLFYFLSYERNFVRTNAFLANSSAFYYEILDKVNDVDFRKELYIEVFKRLINSPIWLFKDLNYLLLKDTKMAIDILQNLGDLDFIFDFLGYKLYINNENFIEIVPSISNFINKTICDGLWVSSINFIAMDRIHSPLYQSQVLFASLNKISKTLDSPTVAIILDRLHKIIESYYNYQFNLLLRPKNILTTIPDKDEIEIQKAYTNVYILLENIITNLKIFYKDISEKINELDNLLIKMNPHYSNKLNFEEIYFNYYALEKKEDHFTGEFDTKKIAEGFSEFLTIIKELKNLTES